MRRFSVATITSSRPRRAMAVAGALAWLAACGSGASKPAPGGAGGTGGAPNGIFGRIDAGAADQPHDAAPVFSCAAAADGGTVCIQFDPDYQDPAGACAAHQGGPVMDAPCSPDGSAGGCHVAAGTSGYTIWTYGRQTAGALIVRCQQLGDSYVSPGHDVTVDASAHATGPGPDHL